MRVVLTNANVIDCVNPRALVGASVTVEHGRIVEVLGSNRAPDTRDAQVIDLHGSYLLCSLGCGTCISIPTTSRPPPHPRSSRRYSSATTHGGAD